MKRTYNKKVVKSNEKRTYNYKKPEVKREKPKVEKKEEKPKKEAKD